MRIRERLLETILCISSTNEKCNFRVEVRKEIYTPNLLKLGTTQREWKSYSFVCVCLCMYVCVCVCEREIEFGSICKRMGLCVWVNVFMSECVCLRVSACVCVCIIVSECVFLSHCECACVRVRERRINFGVCLWESECKRLKVCREREREKLHFVSFYCLFRFIV